MVSYKFKKECYFLRSCLVDAGKRLLFMVEQLFLPIGEVWSLNNAEIQGMVGEREEAKRQTNVSCLNFSYLGIQYEFYFMEKRLQNTHV